MSKTRRGGSLLVALKDQCPVEDLQGDEAMVMSNPIINDAFTAVIAKYSILHPIALVSLCTARRPYSKSPKWRVCKNLFGAHANLIIMSNAGIIPIEFEDQFPYLVYDAPRDPKHDGLYHDLMVGRLIRFFTVHRHRSILFYTPHTQRNRAACECTGKALKGMGAIEEYALLPTKEQYENMLADDFKKQGFNYQQLLHPACLQPVAAQINKWAGTSIELQYSTMAELNAVVGAFDDVEEAEYTPCDDSGRH